MKQYILVLDQGTTSSRSIIFDKTGAIVSEVHQEFKQIYPKPGWVEHDPDEIIASQLYTMRKVFEKIDPQEIAAIGITNQRETTVLWDKKTGKPVHNAIVWQCRRSAAICDRLKTEGFDAKIKQKTGLVTDAYFSATKIKWIFDNHSAIKKRAEKGEILFGTIDTWLLYNLTKGKVHATDYSNASRTMLFNIHDLKWDREILTHLEIPESILPHVASSSEVYGYLDKRYLGIEIPIAGIAGDQQAALFGQTCFDVGDVKNTYGTGCFMLMNTGQTCIESNSGLLTSIGWKVGERVEYVLEGSVFIAGAVIQWLRDELKIISNAKEAEVIAASIADNQGVYFVPAFVGLGAPYWNMSARGAITGLTRGSGQAAIVRAALESIAYQTRDVLDCIQKDSDITIKSLNVDGGVSSSNFLMQFQSDLLNIATNRPHVIETTALGAAYLAGLAVGLFKNKEEIKALRQIDTIFQPTKDRVIYEGYYVGWKRAISRIC